MSKQNKMKNKLDILVLLSLLLLFSCKEKTNTVNKFISMNESLEANFDFLSSNQYHISENLDWKIRKDGKTQKGLILQKKYDDLSRKTDLLLGHISKLKRRLVEEVGNGRDKKTHKIRQPEAKRGVYYLMATKNSAGDDLQSKLDNYVEYIYKEYADLGFDKSILPSLTENNSQYCQKYFSNCSVAEVLALLTERQCRIKEYELEVLSYLIDTYPQRLNFSGEIKAIVSFEKDTIQIGEILEVKISLIEKINNPTLKMTINNQAIKVENGIAKVKFKAIGKGEQTFKAGFIYKHYDKDSTFYLEKKYYVVPN